MTSSDYTKRFLAEYYQLKIRIARLQILLGNAYQGKLRYELSCPIELLERQLDSMLKYLNILEERAFEEAIDL